MLLWLVLVALVVAGGLLSWRSRRQEARLALDWDMLARAFMLGFDRGGRSIRGKYRLLRVEITAGRSLLGVGPWRTQVEARFEGVVPEGLALGLQRGGRLRGSARQPETLERWLDAHRRRELLPPLLRGEVRVSGHAASVEVPGLLTEPEALRTLLTQLADLARLLSER